jgi:hypothetical protein
MSPTNRPGYEKLYYRANKNKYNNPKEKAKRRLRNKARYALTKKYGKGKMRGLDVNHKKPLRSGGSNKRSNLELMPFAKNRADNGK